MGLLLSILIRRAINSSAFTKIERGRFDTNNDDALSYQIFMFIFRNIILLPFTLINLLWSCWWTLALTGFCALGK